MKLDSRTPARIAELGTTILKAAEELNLIGITLSQSAKSELDVASLLFQSRNSFDEDMDRKAYNRLYFATETEKLLHDFAARANTLKQRCAPWGAGTLGRRQDECISRLCTES